MTPDHDPIDDLVREHLEREAATVDARGMLARVTPAAPRRRRYALAAAGAALAACVTGVWFFGESPLVPREASAEELVRDAQAAHATAFDRCYRVTTEAEPPAFRRLRIPPVARSFQVWTRGDQFWLEATEFPAWAMGQEPDGRVWVAVSRKRGLVFEPGEQEEPLRRFCDFVSLRLVSTLAEVLEKFQVRRTDPADGGPYRLEADIRPNWLNRNPRFSRVALELDPKNKSVRSAAFERRVNGEPAGTVLFEFVESAPLSDESYTLAGHLDADAEVLDAKEAGRQRRGNLRDEFLKRLQNRGK